VNHAHGRVSLLGTGVPDAAGEGVGADQVQPPDRADGIALPEASLGLEVAARGGHVPEGFDGAYLVVGKERRDDHVAQSREGQRTDAASGVHFILPTPSIDVRHGNLARTLLKAHDLAVKLDPLAERGGKGLGQPVVATGDARRQLAVDACRDFLDGEAGTGVDALDVARHRAEPIDPARRGALVEQREGTNLDGERGRLAAAQAQSGGKIAETRLQIIQIDQDLRSEVANSLPEIEAQTAEYAERKVSAEDQLKRIDLVAPQSGLVHELAVHTVGGVISPAYTIMLIVPSSDRLALEAQIQPQDIDQIRLGQRTVLRMSAFNQRTTPELNGEVSRIAADLTQDQKSGLSYYVVRIAVSPQDLARLGKLALVPGMPAAAFIQTGERTVISHLVKPLRDQISRAFREE
jgi:HlyD family secretion protein